METIHDFEDMLLLLEKNRVRYLIIGGLAFIYHAKPRYTKDMDLWIDLDTLIRIKGKIDHPRHKEDSRVLREVRKRKFMSSKKRKKS